MACFHFLTQLHKPEKPPLKPAKNGPFSRARAYWSTKPLARARARIGWAIPSRVLFAQVPSKLLFLRLIGLPGFLFIGETFSPAGQCFLELTGGFCLCSVASSFLEVRIIKCPLNISASPALFIEGFKISCPPRLFVWNAPQIYGHVCRRAPLVWPPLPGRKVPSGGRLSIFIGHEKPGP